MQISACRPYHAQAVGQNLLHMPDGKSAFKVYYLSIMGRDKPEQYEWEHSPWTQASFEKAFLAGNYEGVGFVTAFPHVTKIFRFSPYSETILDVTEFSTKDMQLKDCSRADTSHEFACYAEALIAADEYRAWAETKTVEEYLSFRCSTIDFPVISNTKLAAYWEKV
jgi:hypothetical protein